MRTRNKRNVKIEYFCVNKESSFGSAHIQNIFKNLLIPHSWFCHFVEAFELLLFGMCHLHGYPSNLGSSQDESIDVKSLPVKKLQKENAHLRILTGKKHPQIKLQRSLKVPVWAFALLAHQINSLEVVFILKKNVQKNKVVISKTLFSVVGPFCSQHSVCLNTGFWYSSFVWKWCIFNLSAFNKKSVLQFFEKGFRFQNLQLLSHKNISISQTEHYFE